MGMRRATHLQLTQRAEQLRQPACGGVERVRRGAAVRVEGEGEEEARRAEGRRLGGGQRRDLLGDPCLHRLGHVVRGIVTLRAQVHVRVEVVVVARADLVSVVVRCGGIKTVEVVEAAATLLGDAYADGTNDRDAVHFRKWCNVCAYLHTPALRTDVAANSGADPAGHLRECMLQAIALLAMYHLPFELLRRKGLSWLLNQK